MKKNCYIFLGGKIFDLNQKLQKYAVILYLTKKETLKHFKFVKNRIRK